MLPILMAGISMLKTGSFSWPSLPYSNLGPYDWFRIVTLTKVFSAEYASLWENFKTVNAVYWSLAIEFQFYLVVYLALLFRKHFHLVLVATTAASVALIFRPGILNAGVFLHFWPMFALGIALFYIVQKGVTLSAMFPTNSAVIASALLFLASLLLIAMMSGELSNFFPNAVFRSTEFIVSGITAFVLWSSIPFENRLIDTKNNGPWVVSKLIRLAAGLGVISYSIYLIHLPLFSLPAMLVRQVISTHSPIYMIFSVLITLILASLFFLCVEKPFMSAQLRGLAGEVIVAKKRTSGSE